MVTINEILNPDRVILFVVDPQEKLLNVMQEKENVIKKIRLLALTAKSLQLPIVLTTQYKKGIGEVVEELKEALSDINPIDKIEFNAFYNGDVLTEISKIPSSRDIVLLAGVETHICIFQTAIGIIKYGYKPYIIGDATTSRNMQDKELAFQRMRQMGITVGSAEMAIYEMLKKAGTEKFKEILKIVLANS